MTFKTDHLSPAAVYETPINMDWDIVQRNRQAVISSVEICEKCKKPVLVYSGEGDEHRRHEEGDCHGIVDDGNCPAIDYLYPLPDTSDHLEKIRDILLNDPRRAKRLASLPLCVATFMDDSFPISTEHGLQGLALTGCGTDLSWEICEYYMLLGYLPPNAFCVLPNLADRTYGANDRRILSACKATLKYVMRRASYDIGTLRSLGAAARKK